MENSLRLERLNMLKTMLEQHDHIFPEVEFNINTWKDEKRRTSKASCGTAACALGSAALYEPFIKQGLSMTRIGIHDLPTYDGNTGFDAGAQFFGIDWDESIYLFSPEKYLSESPIDNYENHKVTTGRVANRVAKIIKEYEAQDGQ